MPIAASAFRLETKQVQGKKAARQQRQLPERTKETAKKRGTSKASKLVLKAFIELESLFSVPTKRA